MLHSIEGTSDTHTGSPISTPHPTLVSARLHPQLSATANGTALPRETHPLGLSVLSEAGRAVGQCGGGMDDCCFLLLCVQWDAVRPTAIKFQDCNTICKTKHSLSNITRATVQTHTTGDTFEMFERETG